MFVICLNTEDVHTKIDCRFSSNEAFKLINAFLCPRTDVVTLRKSLVKLEVTTEDQSMELTC